jgi:uncharacterized protein (TIGR00255 family)
MTGCSNVHILEGDLGVSVGIKSTNHRFLDAQVRVPSVLEQIEPVLRQMIKEGITRGHVETTVSADHPGGSAVRLNRPLLLACVAAWRELAGELGVNLQLELGPLMALPGILAVENGQWSEEEGARLRAMAERAMARALDQLNEMRAREGATLEADLRRRLEQVRALTEEIGRLSGRASEAIRERLEGRIQELAGIPHPDPARLAQEVAYLASRFDISEELTRLAGHLDHAHRLLQKESEVGKNLDFLLQEMNREANTLLAKSAEVPQLGLEVSRLGIEIKSQIEKLREQAQNIE